MQPPRSRTATTTIPAGEADPGFTDAELVQLDRWIRNNTTQRFGPVREVDHDARKGIVPEIAFNAASAPPATNPASPCASPASPASASTRNPSTPTASTP